MEHLIGTRHSSCVICSYLLRMLLDTSDRICGYNEYIHQLWLDNKKSPNLSSTFKWNNIILNLLCFQFIFYHKDFSMTIYIISSLVMHANIP